MCETYTTMLKKSQFQNHSDSFYIGGTNLKLKAEHKHAITTEQIQSMSSI